MPFPAQPWTNGQQYNDGTYTYQYNSTLRTWTKVKQTTANISLTPASTGGNITVGNTVISNTAIASNTLSTTGNANLGNISTPGIFSATGNVSGGNITTSGVVSATGNVSGGNITTAGVVSATGNVSGGNITTSGVVSATGNVSGGNITTSGVISASGNASVLGIKTDNYYYANGVAISFAGSYSDSNVANYLPTYNGNVGGGTATFYGTTLTTGSNSTAGTITGNWTLSTGSKFQATYADLAEYYEADKPYESGLVLEFGGTKEVTLATDGTTKVAGIVSTNPAYALNANCQGEHPVLIALQGRVPCKVRGKINKGDMMISGGNGYARPCASPTMGSVIGKALQDFSDIEGVIEIAVGRL